MTRESARRSPTIKDVARMASVSTTTISRYLNGKFDTMSPQTKARVQEVIQQLDYKPSQIARGLRNARSKSLGVIVADILNPYSIAVLKGLEDACTKAGYSMIVCNTDEDPKKELKCIQMLEANRVDGLVVNSTLRNNEHLVTIAESIPLVLLDRKIEGSNIDTVTTNNAQGTCLAIEHLVGRGCTHIVMIIREADGISPRYERITAFREFFDRIESRNFRSQLVTLPNYDQAEVTMLLRKVLRNMNSEDRLGLILGNGVLSLMALKSLRELGVAISRDLLMVAFDDPEWASITQPSLTVVAQPTYEIGRTAARMLLKKFKQAKKSQAPSQVLQLDMHLIARQSSVWS